MQKEKFLSFYLYQKSSCFPLSGGVSTKDEQWLNFKEIQSLGLIWIWHPQPYWPRKHAEASLAEYRGPLELSSW